VSGLPQRFCYRRYELNRGETIMNIRKLALFAGGAVIVAGGLIYALGIYPPASWRNAHGAIGQRDVYHAEQPADATVTPGAAPVAVSASAEQMKSQNLQNAQMNQLNDGQLVQTMNGVIYRVSDGQMIQLMNGQVFQKNGMTLRMENGQILQMNGQMANMMHDQFMRMTNGQLVRLMNGQVYQMNSGRMVQLMNGQFFHMNGQMVQLMNGQILQMNGQMANMMNGQMQMGMRQQ
jgi:hypothetical protein